MARILDKEVRFAFLIHDVSRLRRVMFDRIVRNLGTSRSQWWVLAFLSRDDGSPQTNLADELDVGKVALGGLVDRLEEAGMVERRADPIDRRVKRVFLTKEGRKLVSQNKELDKGVNDTGDRGVGGGFRDDHAYPGEDEVEFAVRARWRDLRSDSRRTAGEGIGGK